VYVRASACIVCSTGGDITLEAQYLNFRRRRHRARLAAAGARTRSKMRFHYTRGKVIESRATELLEGRRVHYRLHARTGRFERDLLSDVERTSPYITCTCCANGVLNVDR
jgi:hypothetical protein